MPAADLRGFRDPLALVRLQRGWALDRAVARLGAARTAYHDAIEQQRAALEELQAQANAMAKAWAGRGDPVAYARLLAYLTQLQQRHAHAEAETARRGRVMAEAQAEVLACTRDCEALETQRREALEAYRLEQDRRMSAQADEAWLLRPRSREGAAA
jgi:hypothetical protein